MAAIVFIAASLDGFIAGPGGEIEWLTGIPNPGGSDYGFGEFMDRIDAVIMGRNTFEKVLTMGQWMYTKPVFVLSSKLKEIPEKLSGKAEVISGEPEAVLRQLNEKGYSDFYVDGGVTIQSFLKKDLIDEMIISTIPVILGEGISLFGNIGKTINFKYAGTEVYDDMIIKSHFIRDRQGK